MNCKYQVIGYKITRNTNVRVLSGLPEHPHQKFGIIGKPLRYKRFYLRYIQVYKRGTNDWYGFKLEIQRWGASVSPAPPPKIWND